MPKIVIDIDEKIIQQAKHYHDLPYDDYVVRVAEAIVNGIPLDDIKAEIIEHAYPVCYDRNSIEKGMTLTGIMQVFDKHISGKENE